LQRERERERERDDQRVSSRVNITKEVERNTTGLYWFFLFVFTDLRTYTPDSVKERGIPFYISDLEPLRGKYNLPLKGFFALNETQKLLRFYETMYGDTEIYSPETLCIKSFVLG
jgi:hypothetical protein